MKQSLWHTWRFPLSLLALDFVVLAWSFTGPSDGFTWFLEVAPFLIVLPILLITAPRFRFTNLCYIFIALHAMVLMVGGRYTYAEVPLFNWLKEAAHLARNHYDRVGHFMQGFVPALVIREVLLRTSPLKRGKWLFTLVASMCLAISACYEFIEWWVAASTGEAADAFLGSQGDVWDTQWDMFCALLGALTALLTFAGVQDRQLAKRGLAT